MEKISGIIPASPRVKAVDLENSQPVRKGVPAFGRKTVGSDSGDKVTLSSVERAGMSQKLETYNPRDLFESQIPVDMADKFFLSPYKEEAEASPSPVSAAPIQDVAKATAEPQPPQEVPVRKLDVYA